jgi:hypothetical protein
MQRYFFHLDDGDRTFVDDQGEELADLAAVRVATVRIAGEILRDGVPPVFWSGRPWRVCVVDSRGHLIHIVVIAASTT